MAEIPAGAKKPQDHKSKAEKTTDQVFTFEFGGETYESKPVGDVLTPGFMRANRRRDDIDQLFTIFEALFSEAVLARTVDKMSREEFGEIGDQFTEFMQVSLGESQAS